MMELSNAALPVVLEKDMVPFNNDMSLSNEDVITIWTNGLH